MTGKWKHTDQARRRLLQGTAIVAAAGLAPWSLRAIAAGEQAMMKRAIPATGETVPVVGLGTSDEFSVRGEEELGALAEVLRQFRALGGTLVDTAPAYGNAEEVIGRLLADLGFADDLFIATKVRTQGTQAGIAQMERSEALLGKSPLDLLQVHSLVDVDAQLDNLRRWQDQGRVRYIGITHSRSSAFDQLERLMKREKLDFVQLNYSFLEPDAEARLLPLAADRDIAVMVNRPYLNGSLFRRVKGRELPPWTAEFDCQSWAQLSLKYILANEAVTCVIPATSSPKHLVDNMGAGTGALPDPSALERIRALADTL